MNVLTWRKRLSGKGNKFDEHDGRSPVRRAMERTLTLPRVAASGEQICDVA
ncbi:hypothetical protein Rhow_004558 [Rhodococcus wratislaviensis]|uniref:Uncharacterized protein n=1 Tax=Rhodococcus wratislaviensis TaxID=44752 RepID=A0A402CB97_RHOWR|nr:hypothetical protein [Rhodococcus wratislaviensis]GCE40915.1 hypothetical protein Rhow_004558 [Rhodococcus wratislaviensis]